MASLKSIALCAHCGTRRARSKDHIPPKCLFPKDGRDVNLITVPSCASCNEGANKDDEYFKTHLVLRYDVHDNAEAQKNLPSVLRGLKREKNARMLGEILTTSKPVNVVTESGLFIDTAVKYEVDQDRINRVARRVVTGLYYRERSKPLPKGYGVKTVVFDGTARLTAEWHKFLSQVLPVAGKGEVHEIGKQIFRYQLGAFDYDPDTTVTFMTFYESLHFVGITYPIRKAAELAGST